jgi:AcrR family transcriptional regulator
LKFKKGFFVGRDESPAKRDAILKAALDLFSERGFHGTAMPLVAERAGVGAGTIYRYFASKEALVNAVYQQWKLALREAILHDFPFTAPPREQFRTFWFRLADFAAKNPEAFLFLELHHHAPYLDDESKTMSERGRGEFHRFFETGQAMAALKPLPPELLATLVWSAFVGLFKESRAGQVELTPERLAEAETCCWEAVRL